MVHDAGRVLLIQWTNRPPGAADGVLEPGEDITAGLRREIAEETGLDHRADRPHRGSTRT